MELMKRCWFNIMAAFSLLLCAATLGLWVRSYYVMDDLCWSPRFSNASAIELNIFRGGMTYWNLDYLDGPYYPALLYQSVAVRELSWPGLASVYPGGRFRRWSWAGFEWIQLIGGTRNWSIRAPFWIFVLATSIFPLLWFWRRRRHRRQTLALAVHGCLNCGYDLRASKERCPECGTAIPVVTEIST